MPNSSKCCFHLWFTSARAGYDICKGDGHHSSSLLHSFSFTSKYINSPPTLVASSSDVYSIPRSLASPYLLPSLIITPLYNSPNEIY